MFHYSSAIIQHLINILMCRCTLIGLVIFEELVIICKAAFLYICCINLYFHWNWMIVLWCTGGFKGALSWSPLMPRDASLSDSYKSVGDVFPVWQSFYTEKTIFPFPFILNGIWSWWQFSFNFEPNGFQFGLKLKGKLSPRSYPI